MLAEIQPWTCRGKRGEQKTQAERKLSPVRFVEQDDDEAEGSEQAESRDRDTKIREGKLQVDPTKPGRSNCGISSRVQDCPKQELRKHAGADEAGTSDGEGKHRSGCIYCALSDSAPPAASVAL